MEEKTVRTQTGRINTAYDKSEEVSSEDRSYCSTLTTVHTESVDSTVNWKHSCFSFACCYCSSANRRKVHTIDEDNLRESSLPAPYNISSSIPDVIESYNIHNNLGVTDNICDRLNLCDGHNCRAKSPNQSNFRVNSFCKTHLLVAGPQKVLIDLEHVIQRHSWDCGIACVMMVLNASDRQYLAENIGRISKEEGFHQR